MQRKALSKFSPRLHPVSLYALSVLPYRLISRPTLVDRLASILFITAILIAADPESLVLLIFVVSPLQIFYSFLLLLTVS